MQATAEQPTVEQPSSDGGARIKKRDKRRADKRKERDKWAEEVAAQDERRMAKCTATYHESLLTNIPIQPPCMYPIRVDGGRGVFVPIEPVRDIIVENCPLGNEEKVATYSEVLRSTHGTAMRALADEMNGFQMGALVDPSGLDAQIRAAYAKHHVVVGALALAVVLSTFDGHAVHIKGFPSTTSKEAVEMAFFSFGNLLHTLATRDGCHICYFIDRFDAEIAVQKMNGRVWRGSTLQVTLV
eukprot:TRINITY_DN23348_c0_g1_i1.p1 TRINITY_DN23348_c0_g1~~TRINITY_DN23348_c0_g1_i1.p1  ORF type:complete len:242 (+),score=89.03 TRINITY_DN23348_c0_g1_i1:60-785(+)